MIINWYSIDKSYVNYLKKYDKNVPNIDYTGRLKCFLGIIIQINSIAYFAPLTSYKKKFDNMNNDIDFYKIIGKNRKVYGAININNMIPVSKNEYLEITFENLDELRIFKNKRDKKQYWKLLQTELSCINEEIILYNARRLYKYVQKYPNSILAR